MVGFMSKSASHQDDALQPDGNSQHFQFIEAAGDELDMILRNANGSDSDSYYLHIPRGGEQNPAHAVLYSGVDRSAPIAAASVYSTSTSGSIMLSDHTLAWGTPHNAVRSDVTVSSRTLSWYKTFSAPPPGMNVFKARKPSNLIWTLTDVTDAPASEANSLSHPGGTTLATLTIMPLEGKHSLAEAGNLVWLRPAEKEVRDAAVMLVMALWHRDRQVRTGGNLDPAGEVNLVRRTAGRQYAGGLMSLGMGESMAGGGGSFV